MLMALLDGRARPAGELAYAASVSAQTASSHLGKLLMGGLLSVEQEGRHRYYRLANSHIALVLEMLAAIGCGSGSGEAIETLGILGAIEPARMRRKTSRQAPELQLARCCYDHLAGRVGVSIAHRLQALGYIKAVANQQFDVTPEGMTWFNSIGVEVSKIKPSRRGLARQCLDWTEREHHLAGPLGTQLMQVLCDKDWLRRSTSSRIIHITLKGASELFKHLGVDIDRIRDSLQQHELP